MPAAVVIHTTDVLGQKRLINHDYARLRYGQAVSVVGDMVFDTTLVLWVATVLARGKAWAWLSSSSIQLASRRSARS